ncbi:MAG: urease accessory protein UreD [Pseudomonadota bacterium]
MAEALLQADHHPGWVARLELEFAMGRDVTVLRNNRHSGPLRVQRPLYPEPAVCHACILHPPGGVVGGDLLEIHADVRPGAAALITTPGATKFYRSGGATAIQENRFAVDANGGLEWFPQENIVFPGAKVNSTTRVSLDSGAAFIGWELFCIGLPACKAPFSSGLLETSFEICRDGRPLFKDRLMIRGEADLHRPAGMRGASVSATFAATGCSADMLAPLRQILDAEPAMLAGVTLMDDLLVARYLGDASSEAKTLFQAFWTCIRPSVTGRKACAPRIWAT